MNLFANLYDEAGMEPERRRSLNWILGGNLCGNLWGIVCGGGTAAMVGLAAHYNASDLQLGLLVAIPQIATLLQIPCSILVNRTGKRRQYMLTWGIAARILWLLFGFVPLIFDVGQARWAMLTMFMLMATTSCVSSMINVCWFPWFSDVAPVSIRGRWFSYRDMINSGLGLAFGLLIAFLLDTLPESSRFLTVFLIGGGFGVCDMLCFGCAKDKWAQPRQRVELRKTFADMLRCRPFTRFTVMWTVWAFTANMSDAYITPYAMNVMGLNFMQYTVFGTMTASFATMLFIPRWGRLLDRFGGRNVMLLSCVCASLCNLFYLISAPGSVWPTFLRNLFGAAFWCGSNLAANSMQLTTSPNENRSTYIAFFSCITCLLGGALGTLCGGWFLDGCRDAGLFTGSFDRYMMLFAFAAALRLGTTLLFVPRLDNDKGISVRAMLRTIKGK